MKVLRGLSEGRAVLLEGCCCSLLRLASQRCCAVSGAGTSGPPSAECQSPVHHTCSWQDPDLPRQGLCSVSSSASSGPQVHSGKRSPVLSSVFEPPPGESLSPHNAPRCRWWLCSPLLCRKPGSVSSACSGSRCLAGCGCKTPGSCPRQTWLCSSACRQDRSPSSH